MGAEYILKVSRWVLYFSWRPPPKVDKYKQLDVQMCGKKSECDRHTLVYDDNDLQPEDLLNFIELSPFIDSWKALKLSDEHDLAALQIAIMADPRAGDVMPGTRGLRKLRFSPEIWETGKRGALRVCYVYFEKYGLVLLCLAFKKSELESLSDKGKKAITRSIKRIEAELLSRYGF